jgi:type II restriction enzyme
VRTFRTFLGGLENAHLPGVQRLTMEMFGNIDLGLGYSSRTQKVRMISEDWIARHAYCLRCDSDKLSPTRANTQSRDFICGRCSHSYELKSKRGSFSSKVLDGAYGAMLQTIREGRTPTFLLLEYSTSWSILRLRAIHHSLITETAIQPRKPLAASARRAGWIGCNIVLPEIAVQGQIPLVADGLMCAKSESRQAFARLESLSSLSTANRTWAATILRFTNRLGTTNFSLQDMYGFESEFQSLFPDNRHVRAKIRQQLQVLRDAGILNFLGSGKYELL